MFRHSNDQMPNGLRHRPLYIVPTPAPTAGAVCPSGGDTGAETGVGSAWEQRKLQARKILAAGAAERESELQANTVRPA
jgi:hypothetical protein